MDNPQDRMPPKRRRPLEDTVPSALLELPQWVAWKIEYRQDRAGKQKPTKVPYNPRTGQLASSTDVRTWSDVRTACRRAATPGYHGVGFVATKDDPYTGIDLDRCRDAETGAIEPWAVAIIQQMNSYTEISPSGRGVRIFLRGKLPPGRRRKGAIEMYDTDRFFTVTGNHLDGTSRDVEDRQAELDALHRATFGEKEREPSQPSGPHISEPARLDDAAIVKKAREAKNGAEFMALWSGDTSAYDGDVSRADMALLSRLAFYTQDEAQLDRLFRQSGLMREKWDREDYRQRTIAAARSGRDETYSGKITPMRPPTTKPLTNGTTALQIPPAEEGQRKRYARTELGNSERLLDAYGAHFRYTKAMGYCVWDGKRWRPGAELVVEKWAKQVIRDLYREAAELATQAAACDDESERERLGEESQDRMKWALQSQTDRMVRAMLSLCRSASVVEMDQFDTNSWLFNCANGTIDLRTGELHSHRREDYLMQYTPVEFQPKATCPRFERFLTEIMLGDAEMVAYLQRVLGYTLTGDVSEQVWHLMVGEGENGKSVLMETFAKVLGDYAHMMSPDSITMSKQPRRGSDASPDVAVLKGKRFVRITETPEGAHIDAARIKALSGSDEVVARMLHKDFFVFFPTFKIFVYTNHKPETRETTHAFWRRVRFIPFELNLREHPEQKDKALPDKLAAELPGILAWAVRGSLLWRQQGLNPPQKVLEATEAYQRDSDFLRDFLESRCVIRPAEEARASDLYKAYSEWCEEAGEHRQNQRRFGKALTERRFDRKNNNGIVYVGLRLRLPTEQESLFTEGTEGTEPTSRKSSLYTYVSDFPEQGSEGSVPLVSTDSEEFEV